MSDYRISDGKHAKGYKVFTSGPISGVISLPPVVDREFTGIQDKRQSLSAARDVLLRSIADSEEALMLQESKWWRERGEDLNIDLTGYTCSGGTIRKMTA